MEHVSRLCLIIAEAIFLDRLSRDEPPGPVLCTPILLSTGLSEVGTIDLDTIFASTTVHQMVRQTHPTRRAIELTPQSPLPTSRSHL